MSNGNSHFSATNVARSTPFDKDNAPDCEFESEDVQSVVEELCRRTARSASPGFAWGRAGQQTANIYLKSNEVSSQRVGIPFDLTNGKIVKIFVGNQDVNTFDVTIYEHQGDSIGLTALVTVSVVASRGGFFDISDFGTINLTQDRQIAARLTSGSAKNVQVYMIAKGEVAI